MQPRKTIRSAAAAGIAVTSAFLAGCGGNQPRAQALSDADFLGSQKTSAVTAAAVPAAGPQADPVEPQPTAAGAPVLASSMEPPSLQTAPPAPAPSGQAESTTGGTAAPAARHVAAPVVQPTSSSNSSDNSAEASNSTDSAAAQDGDLYMTVGGVVADVNGTPIYASTILSLLNAEFAAKAREMDPQTFRAFARGELDRQVRASIDDEAEFAAAQVELSDDDKKVAQMIAQQDREKIVTASGGSAEVASRRSEADGTGDLDQAMQQHYRRVMQQVFYQRKIMPRIQVSATDMRKFYDENVDKLYSTPAVAQFRVIKIDPARIGGPNARAQAIARINNIRQRALHGEDFATLASTENQDEYLKSRAGDPGGPMQRDSYRIDAIDHAVWQLQPGQITPVIETDDAFWIAKLEMRNDGRVRPFDDQAVQDDIHNRLWQQQFVALRESLLQQMDTEAVVRRDDSMMQTALDMAMQEYARWHQAAQ